MISRLQALLGQSARPLHLYCDFDGTLVPIQDDPALCYPDAALLSLLQRLAADPAVRLAVLSGRSLEDLSGRLDLPAVALAGNHGLEIAVDDRRWSHPGALALRPLLCRQAERARALLADIPGAWVEDKILTLSLHSRQVPVSWRPLLQRRLARLEHGCPDAARLRWHRGREVVEIRPALGWSKASAARLLLGGWGRPRGRYDLVSGGGVLFYAGDDCSDEDVFRAFPEAITVRIGVKPAPTAARFRMADPQQLRRLLESLSES